MDKRFVVWPGKVASKTDGQTHTISVADLRHLYRIPPGARWIDGADPSYREQPGDVHLRPLFSGNYEDYDLVAHTILPGHEDKEVRIERVK